LFTFISLFFWVSDCSLTPSGQLFSFIMTRIIYMIRWDDDDVHFVLDQYNFYRLAHWNNSPRVDVSLHPDTLTWFRANQSLFLLLIATHTNFIVFDLTQFEIEHTIYRTRGKHANHYSTGVVLCTSVDSLFIIFQMSVSHLFQLIRRSNNIFSWISLLDHYVDTVYLILILWHIISRRFLIFLMCYITCLWKESPAKQWWSLIQQISWKRTTVSLLTVFRLTHMTLEIQVMA